MKKQHYFCTKEGGFVLAFLVILLAFALIMVDLRNPDGVLHILGLLLILGAMLYAPIRTFWKKEK